MTHQSIYINHQGKLLLIDAPDKEDFKVIGIIPGITYEATHPEYQAALASAIAKGVKFKDTFETWKVMDKAGCFSEGLTMVECKGQTFPLPTGYKVNFEGDFTKEKACRKCDCNFPMQYSRCDCPCHDIDEKVAILSKLEEEKTPTPTPKEGLLGLPDVEFEPEDIVIKPVYTSEQKLKVVAPSEEVKQESQDELWMDVCVECHAIEKVGVAKVIRTLMEKFKIERF